MELGIFYHALSDPGFTLYRLRADLGLMAGAKITRIYAWVTNLYLEALRRPTLFQKELPHTAWDSLAVLIAEAGKLGIAIDLWTPVCVALDSYRAPVTREHPDWRVLTWERKPLPGSIDLAIPDAGNYMLEALRFLDQRYPADDEVDNPGRLLIEEPYYDPSSVGNVSYTSHFRAWFLAWHSYDPTYLIFAPPPAEKMLAVKKDVMTTFMKRVKLLGLSRDLGCTGPVDKEKDGFAGGEWPLDWYVPMVYNEKEADFIWNIEHRVLKYFADVPIVLPAVARFVKGTSNPDFFKEISDLKKYSLAGASIFSFRQLSSSDFVQLSLLRPDYRRLQEAP